MTTLLLFLVMLSPIIQLLLKNEKKENICF